MYAIAENFCEKERIDFKNLLPLINEVTLKVNSNSPHDVQTGPAMREDISLLTVICNLFRHMLTLNTSILNFQKVF